MREYLAGMLRYAGWANRRTLESLHTAPAAYEEALPLLAHVLAAEHIWLARLERRAPVHQVWPALTIEACRALLDENERGFRAYVERPGDDPPAGRITYGKSGGAPYVASAIDVLTHVTTHGAYHRGQIARIVRRRGGTPVNTDYITFARESEPTA